MAQMAFGQWANDTGPKATVSHLRVNGKIFCTGKQATFSIDSWTQPKMVTCKRCLKKMVKEGVK